MGFEKKIKAGILGIAASLGISGAAKAEAPKAEHKFADVEGIKSMMANQEVTQVAKAEDIAEAARKAEQERQQKIAETRTAIAQADQNK